MKVKQLLNTLFNIEQVIICKANKDVEWSGLAYYIPEKYYNYEIDKICSFPFRFTDTCIYIIIK